MLKITRYNRNSQEVESVIRTEDIIGLTERKRDPKYLYDENGEIAKTIERENDYIILFTNRPEMFISKDTYDKLLVKLNVETL